MNSLVVKALLGLSLMGKAPVESVVVSIDKYETPTHDTVYLLGDAHFGSAALIRQEQIDFMKAVKSKENAYVIAEDASHYDGDNHEVKEFIEAHFRGIVKNTALRDLVSGCKKHDILVFNAECRHEIVHAKKWFDTGSAYDNLAAKIMPVMHNLRQYNIDWLRNYRREYIEVDEEDNIKFKALDDNTGSFFASKSRKVKKEEDFQNKAVDIRILNAIHTIVYGDLQSSELKIENEGKKNIFIFAGFAHIRNLIPTLEKYLKYVARSAAGQKKFSARRPSIKELVDTKGELLGGMRKQKIIDTYGVNITEFFAQEEDQEKQESCE